MQEIKIYDFDFNLIASEFKCVSFEWDTRFNSIGTFKGVFTLDSDIYNCCANRDFLVCVQGENQGIITSVRIEDDKIIVSGKGVNYILQKRACLPFSTKDDGTEKSAPALVCELVNKYCGDFMEVLSPPAGYPLSHFSRIEAKPVFEIISDILAGANLGHFVKFDVDNKKWVFGCLEPKNNNIVLSQPDKSLSDCDYVRYLSDYAAAGVYKQKPYFMGSWNAATNLPSLWDMDKNNFAKVYKVEEGGNTFGLNFSAGDYIVCLTEDGKWQKSSSYGHFWHKVTPKAGVGAYRWENVLSCDDISEATEMTLLNEIDENVVALVQGISQKEFQLGDMVKIQLGKGNSLKVFYKQIKRIVYHYEWGNCFVRPTFYKIKEREDE
ncbi:MAG: hypothetical protein IJE46_06065 [Clostridia bacterium]|nr:hypothetical protein [Clostridia bacterium]